MATNNTYQTICIPITDTHYHDLIHNTTLIALTFTIQKTKINKQTPCSIHFCNTVILERVIKTSDLHGFQAFTKNLVKKQYNAQL